MNQDHQPQHQSNHQSHAKSPDMTCQECVDFLMDYLDEQLPSQQRQVFDAHLARCPQCRVFIDNYALTTRLLKQSSADAPGDSPGLGGAKAPISATPLPDSLVRAILQAQQKRSS